MRKFSLGGFLFVVCMSLGACASDYWPESDYAFSADTHEGLLIMSVTLAPNPEVVYDVNYMELAFEDLTPPDPNRQAYAHGALGLLRSRTKPDRFALGSAPFGGRTRDDLVIAKLPAGKYAINSVQLFQGDLYQIHYFRDKKYYFEIRAAKAIYVGDVKIIRDERIDKPPFAVQIQDMREVDLPLFYETMKNIPHQAVVVDLLQVK